MDAQAKLRQLLKKAKVEQEGPASLVEDLDRLDEQFRSLHQVNSLSKPVKGVDYFTAEEIADFKEAAKGEQGDQGEPGIDGKDGRDGKDAVATNGKDGKDGTTPVKGVDYLTPAEVKAIKDELKGQDGESVDVAMVIKAIKALKGQEAADFSEKIGAMIDIGHLRNAQSFRQSFKFNGKKYGVEELMHGGGSSTGGGSNPQIPTGTINGSNTIFTVTGTISALYVNGQFMVPGGVDYTLSGQTITLVTAPPAGSTIYSI
jgi:hypothetical protein